MDIADIRSPTDLPPPPKWAIEILLERHTRSTAKVQWDVLGQQTTVHKDGLLAHEQDWFEGRAYVKRQYGSVGRSVTLFNIGRIVAAQGYDGASIVATLGGPGPGAWLQQKDLWTIVTSSTRNHSPARA